ncbi:histone deacetylase/AcuC/AphA family protein [Vibrio ichthyoenteri ATCC 700023]|uniref:Histone deacetylase/AcuC/AphA family protein n=1 Tax=Vibrio ichthyoenteri ATCC 700023 TaxID=870968 RepID=F9S2S4_9VIBR|nr:histone deacetylase [Vibrio ichthyoenteri]EGU38848.1 histone deacetylase/AcuC/AphA family protein [Vibrio ichthyoenteri ATCC 700023]
MIPLIYHPIYSQLTLPAKHRYPINKYQLLFQAVEQKLHATSIASPAKWLNTFQFFKPCPLSPETVSRHHCPDYIDALLSGQLPAAKMRRIGFPWSEQLIERTLTSAGGTWLTTQLALDYGVAIHLSGGYHHAHYDFGTGFCLINDLAMSAKQALSMDHVDRVLIIDSDVHHGDGTATMCADDERIITVSFHCDKNFPARKPHSDVDIALAKETGDAEFLDHFYSVVETAVNVYQPDLILYDAGVDIHCDDELGYFNVSTQGIYQRDYFILQLARQRKIPIACVIGGGYRDVHQDLVPIHMQLLEASADVYWG